MATNSISSSASANKVLHNVCLTVRQSEIYGLLGASSCGKTTLLRLILGQLAPTSGEILLFKQRIDPEHRPSPSDIGYMPQDIVLYHEFTAIEMLLYFGRLYRMSASKLKSRIDQLLRLLDLSQNTGKHRKEALIKHLSGGQRRRISLAIALLHEPRLLILDEPTVGVDPLLREIIWRHLKYLTKCEKNTVILTTHYIEEARYARMIGFLRHGRLLIQARPPFLLRRYQTNSMEQVFLKLCRENDFWERKNDQVLQNRRLSGLLLDHSNSKTTTTTTTTSSKNLAQTIFSSGFVQSTTMLASTTSDNSKWLFNDHIEPQEPPSTTETSRQFPDSSSYSCSALTIHHGQEQHKPKQDASLKLLQDSATEQKEEKERNNNGSRTKDLINELFNQPNKSSSSSSSFISKSLMKPNLILDSDKPSKESDLIMSAHLIRPKHKRKRMLEIVVPEEEMDPSRIDEVGEHSMGKKSYSASNHSICWAHMSTLMGKNARQVYRNWSLLLFFILLPAIEIALIMLCIGRDISNIPVAVVNQERPEPDLSQVFMDSFPPNAFILLHLDTAEEAVKAVQTNQAAAIIQFSHRFSEALRSRFFSFGFVDEDAQEGEVHGELAEGEGNSIWKDSSVYVRLDMSNQLIGLQIQRQLLTSFLNFAQRLAHSMGFSNHSFKPPIVFGPPVYGIEQSAVVETFIAPGALIMIAFFATTIVTCHLLIHELRQQLIERALIAGATPAEILLSHIVIQTIILLVQLCLMFWTAFKWFAMPYLGSLPLSISLICLQGLCGLMYGLMLSATCPDEIYATTLAIGTFFPSVIIGGIFWPVQSMPWMLQYLSECLPSTQSIDALRYILLRHYGIGHRSVAWAFLVSTFWLAIFFICALNNFKKRI